VTDAGFVMPTRRVDMWFAGSSPQNRLTVLFRLILVIPQFIVVVFLAIVTFFVAVIGWFAALFTGRLPLWAHDWLSGFVRWTTRVGAYALLLTDQYPPFSLDDLSYPVRPIVPAPGELNRLSVLFRIFLAIPASVFASIVRYGLTFPLLIVMWVVVLIRGSMPPTLYTTYAAYLRYEARFDAWFNMLTSEYPWGMLGDRDVTPFGAAAPPAFGAPAPPLGAAPLAGSVPPPPASPPAGGPGGQPEGWAPPVPPPVPPPAPPMSAGGAMPPPSPWERSFSAPGETLPPWGTLVLQGAARGWMIFAIVWGAVVFVGTNALRGNGNNNHNGSVVQVVQRPEAAGPAR
jgi:Domain of unknown function (DUF4389)